MTLLGIFRELPDGRTAFLASFPRSIEDGAIS